MTKILLVEDDKSLREIYGVRLLAEGYDIVSAGDGEEALAMAIKERPDLILSDVMMPKISGFDMLDILRSTTETKDIKVIMMTALSSEEQRQRGENLGADRYLVKSQIGIEDVVRTVYEVLNEDQNNNSTPRPQPQPEPIEEARDISENPDSVLSKTYSGERVIEPITPEGLDEDSGEMEEAIERELNSADHVEEQALAAPMPPQPQPGFQMPQQPRPMQQPASQPDMPQNPGQIPGVPNQNTPQQNPYQQTSEELNPLPNFNIPQNQAQRPPQPQPGFQMPQQPRPMQQPASQPDMPQNPGQIPGVPSSPVNLDNPNFRPPQNPNFPQNQ